MSKDVYQRADLLHPFSQKITAHSLGQVGLIQHPLFWEQGLQQHKQQLVEQEENATDKQRPASVRKACALLLKSQQSGNHAVCRLSSDHNMAASTKHDLLCTLTVRRESCCSYSLTCRPPY